MRATTDDGSGWTPPAPDFAGTYSLRVKTHSTLQNMDAQKTGTRIPFFENTFHILKNNQ
ncbi:hypothetical protein [Rugamonas apoptosis]|uniref:Uncharacterized protein n=1 Tax=Rugamonas apoptosis TaxID=2758570 RepID=A0A7W2FF31_9BURK|nr:hypothetical protein [Rugamonas apoptosis]MBA5690429.1 hypothetical protein [Rugamonas apoptosis]